MGKQINNRKTEMFGSYGICMYTLRDKFSENKASHSIKSKIIIDLLSGKGISPAV